MLAVQTADELLYVPEWEIASITPTYPDRCRVVLADGRVGHRPGQGTGEVWLNPNLVTREGDYWKDPAGYLFPYRPLAELAEPDEYDPLLTIEKQNRVWFLRTDTEESPSDLKSDQITELYPHLRQVSKDLFVNTLRIRRMGSREKGGWVELDTGERILVLATLYHPLANFLGCDSFECMDDSVPYRIWKLRDLPYDLTSAEPERIKKDCPDAATFCRQLLWQVVVEHERGIIRDYGTDHESFALHPLASAGQRCGFQLGPSDLANAVRALLWDDEVILLHQLGYRETEPDKRRVGDRLPHVLLLAAQEQQTEARQAALDLGISLLVLHYNPQLALEYLARELTSPLQLIILAPAKLGRIALRLAQLGLSTMGTPLTIPDLSELPGLVAGLPQPWTTDQTEPFRRVALESPEGLVFVPPQEIVCWSPTLPSRWRVVLASGRVLHHPGPVPPGPWVLRAGHWVRPGLMGIDPAGFTLPAPVGDEPLPPASAPPIPGGPALPCPPEQILWLSAGKHGSTWRLEDGSELASPLPLEQAALHHPGLLSLNRACRINYNRLHSSLLTRLGSGRAKFLMDGGAELKFPTGSFAQRFREVLGLRSFVELGPDPHRLRFLQFRDYPYEIARGEAARLRADFANSDLLIANVLWQVYTRGLTYGDTFSAFFYRPLQAILYRAGFLTRAQMRAPLTAKDKLYQKFCSILTHMVRDCQLFTYQEFGFKDAFPEDRILGTRFPHRILLVEKGDRLEEYARRLQPLTGMTLLVLKGMPSLLATEYFEKALRQVYLGPVEIYFYGDFDEAGWDIGPAFRSQLKFYGRECSRLERLVLASCFTVEEQNLYSRAIPANTPTAVGRIARWLREGGGVQGQARGIHANWLQPFERVQARLQELLG